MTKRTREFDRSEFFGDLFTSMLPHNHVHMATGDQWRAHRKLIGDVSVSYITFYRDTSLENDGGDSRH